jgi:hypothetical protein
MTVHGAFVRRTAPLLQFPIQISNSRHDFATSRRVTPELLQILPPR